MWIYSVVLPLDSRRISTHSCWTCTCGHRNVTQWFVLLWNLELFSLWGASGGYAWDWGRCSSLQSHYSSAPAQHPPVSYDFVTLIFNNFMFYTIRPGTSDWDQKLIRKEFFELRSAKREAHFFITSLSNQTCYNQRSHSLLDIRENAVTSYLR